MMSRDIVDPAAQAKDLDLRARQQTRQIKCGADLDSSKAVTL